MKNENTIVLLLIFGMIIYILKWVIIIGTPILVIYYIVKIIKENKINKKEL